MQQTTHSSMNPTGRTVYRAKQLGRHIVHSHLDRLRQNFFQNCPLWNTPYSGHLGVSIQMVQNLTQYHISEYRLNLITSHLSDTHVNPVENSPLYRVENSLPQGITRTAIRVFCRLTARWVMGSYLLA